MDTLIKAEDIKKSFETKAGELQVLKGIDLEIRQGEMVGVIGASGAGKSTLLHILGALDKPSSGRVLYGDTDIFSIDRNALAAFRNSTIGFVFQFHHLLPEFSAVENVMMPGLISVGQWRPGAKKKAGHEQIRARAEQLLAEFGLSERKGHRPGELSGGEQQRVAVARALILDPKVVLADEPSGNLDTHTGAELFNILVNLNRERGITFILVTHNEALSGRCDRVLGMEDGRLINPKKAVDRRI